MGNIGIVKSISLSFIASRRE